MSSASSGQMAYVEPQSCCDMNVPRMAASTISGKMRATGRSAQGEQICDGQSGREQEQQRPKRQQAVAALESASS
jgi:hypothetical protein